MKQKYVLTAVAVVAVGAVALGTVPMWEGTNSVKQEETRTSIIEDPVNIETDGTGTPTPLPTTAPVTGISHTDSYEDLYAQVKEWQNNSSYSNVQPRIMTVEESADAAGTDSAASNSSMAATMPEEPIDQEYGFDPSSEGKDYSTTTAQEELIDEADIVKTDGSCIYAMDSKGTLRIADAASMKLLCEINGENSSDYKEMYVDGNCLQLICQQEDYITYKGSIDLPSANAGGEKNTDGVRTSYSMPVTTVTVETSSLNTSLVWKYLHSVCFVISSLVGPSPPVTKTIFTLFIALSIASRISSSRSRIETIRRTSMPILFNFCPIQAELVSTTCPISSSSPMVIISANILSLFYPIY